RHAGALFLGAGRAWRRGLLRRGLVRVDVLFDAARRIDRSGIYLEPSLGLVALDEGRAAHVGDLMHRLFRGQAMRNLEEGPLRVAVQKDVALAIDKDGTADLVLPVVVMRDAAQRAFDAAHDDGHVAPGFPAPLPDN